MQITSPLVSTVGISTVYPPAMMMVRRQYDGVLDEGRAQASSFPSGLRIRTLRTVQTRETEMLLFSTSLVRLPTQSFFFSG